MRSELDFFEALIHFAEARTCVEVGVAHGGGTVRLCKAAAANGGHVYGFDIWKRHGLRKQFKQIGSREQVEEKLRKIGISNFTLVQIDTINEKERFKRELDKLCPNGIDFAFIDGCHSYAGVKNDFSVVYPRLTSRGIVAFHDTLMIDGCREFMLDLRTKFCDGTFDVVDFPFGCHTEDHIGISLLVKRSFPILDIPITETCGSISTEREIEQREVKWLELETKGKENVSGLLDRRDKMRLVNVGVHKSRKKFEE